LRDGAQRAATPMQMIHASDPFKKLPPRWVRTDCLPASRRTQFPKE